MGNLMIAGIIVVQLKLGLVAIITRNVLLIQMENILMYIHVKQHAVLKAVMSGIKNIGKERRVKMLLNQLIVDARLVHLVLHNLLFLNQKTFR